MVALQQRQPNSEIIDPALMMRANQMSRLILHYFSKVMTKNIYLVVCSAQEEPVVWHIPNKENVADLMTKVLYGQKRRCLVSSILYDIHDDHLLSVSVSTDTIK